MMPASGIITTNAASAAWFAIMQASATEGVSQKREALATLARMAAANRPDRSATPAPSMTVSTMPNGGKCVKVSGTSVNSRRKFASLSRLSTVTMRLVPVSGSISPGCAADHPARLATTESATSTAMNQTKSSTGSGRRLPVRSTQPRKPVCP